MSVREKIENPHLAYFLRGHPGLRLREDVEKELGVKIQLVGGVYDEVIVEGGGSEAVAWKAWEELRAGWYEDDFAKAKEIFELAEAAEAEIRLNVAPKHVSSLIGHYGRRVAGLENRSGASIKIDCTGHVLLLGSPDACLRGKAEVLDWVRHENGDPTAARNGDPAEDGLSPPSSTVSCLRRDPPNSPASPSPASITELRIWLPAAALSLLQPHIPALETEHRCFISVRKAPADQDPKAAVPVDLTSQLGRAALHCKDAIMALLGPAVPSDWGHKVKIRSLGQTTPVSPVGVGSEDESPSSLGPPVTASASTNSINGGPPPLKGEFRQAQASTLPPVLPPPPAAFCGAGGTGLGLMGAGWRGLPPMMGGLGGAGEAGLGPLGFANGPWGELLGPAGFPKRPGGPNQARLTFSVAEEHAPRLIGSRGVNKRKLEEQSGATLILRTEERAGGVFPVDVLAASPADCERARNLLCAFLHQPCASTQLPPPTFSLPQTLAPQQDLGIGLPPLLAPTLLPHLPQLPTPPLPAHAAAFHNPADFFGLDLASADECIEGEGDGALGEGTVGPGAGEEAEGGEVCLALDEEGGRPGHGFRLPTLGPPQPRDDEPPFLGLDSLRGHDL